VSFAIEKSDRESGVGCMIFFLRCNFAVILYPVFFLNENILKLLKTFKNLKNEKRYLKKQKK